MKRFMTILCAILVSGAALSAQETGDTISVATKDTLVVIVKHEQDVQHGFLSVKFIESDYEDAGIFPEQLKALIAMVKNV